jgi:hypothetical protein
MLVRHFRQAQTRKTVSQNHALLRTTAHVLRQLTHTGHEPLNWKLVMRLHILKLILIQAKVVAQFVDDRQTDLFPDLGLIGANRFNILLVKDDVVGSRGQVKTALLCFRHAVEETQQQPLLPQLH